MVWPSASCFRDQQNLGVPDAGACNVTVSDLDAHKQGQRFGSLPHTGCLADCSRVTHVDQGACATNIRGQCYTSADTRLLAVHPASRAPRARATMLCLWRHPLRSDPLVQRAICSEERFGQDRRNHVLAPDGAARGQLALQLGANQLGQMISDKLSSTVSTVSIENAIQPRIVHAVRCPAVLIRRPLTRRPPRRLRRASRCTEAWQPRHPHPTTQTLTTTSQALASTTPNANRHLTTPSPPYQRRDPVPAGAYPYRSAADNGVTSVKLNPPAEKSPGSRPERATNRNQE